ncbi:MAG: hypothetical protein LBK03_00985 [Bacteroidales bacterium]|jgi:hypothetical protein|nr:hypothetical protein [Bacteroidales bacterium]
MRKRLVEIALEEAAKNGERIRALPPVIALRDEIEESLDAGLSLHQIWFAASKNNIFSGCYSAFRVAWEQVVKNDLLPRKPKESHVKQVLTPEKKQEETTAKRPLTADEALIEQFITPPREKVKESKKLTQFKGTGGGIPKPFVWDPHKN